MVLVCQSKLTVSKISCIDNVLRLFCRHVRKRLTPSLLTSRAMFKQLQEACCIFSYCSIFDVSLEMPIPRHSMEALGPLVCVLISSFAKKNVLACVHLFKVTAARMKEGRALYLGHSGVNSEYPLLLRGRVWLLGHRGSRTHKKG